MHRREGKAVGKADFNEINIIVDEYFDQRTGERHVRYYTVWEDGRVSHYEWGYLSCCDKEDIKRVIKTLEEAIKRIKKKYKIK